MASPFLLSFTEAILRSLLDTGSIEVADGSSSRVVEFVASRLHGAPPGDSLVSSFVAALLACPDVDELYADNPRIQQLITDLPATILPRGPS